MTEQTNEKEYGKNEVASSLKVIGWVTIITGLIVGIVLAVTVNFLSGIAFLGIALVEGVLFLGFAEVITLLQKLVERDIEIPINQEEPTLIVPFQGLHRYELSKDGMKALLQKERILKSISDETIRMNDDIWNFIIENQIREIVPVIFDVLNNRERTKYLGDQSFEKFVKRSEEFFGNLPEDEVIEIIYDWLDKGGYPRRFAFYIIRIYDLLDLEKAYEKINADNLDLNKYSLNLLKLEKRNYEVSDIEKFEKLSNLINEKFQPKGRDLIDTGKSSSKEKEHWECECGRKMPIEETYCRNCDKDINGFTSLELKPREAIRIIDSRIQVIKAFYEEQSSMGLA